MENWSREEYQEAVLMMGSKAAFQKFLGIDTVKLNKLWKQHELLSPMEFLRTRNADHMVSLIVKLKSARKAAEYIGVSEASFNLHLKSLTDRGTPRMSYSKVVLIDELTRMKSIRLAARMLDLTESELREQAKNLEIDLKQLIDYSHSNWHNGKGRRAELDFIKLREGKVIEDCNETKGSQAEDYDCVDTELGKVQVKSSRRYRYKASTRSENPFYWKFSTHATQDTDSVVLMLYDKEMVKVVYVMILKPIELAKHPNSVTVVEERGSYRCLKQGTS